jgi:type I restriction enzyme S subunit
MLYEERCFQTTPIGELPRDWQAKTIEDLFNVETGTTPSTSVPAYWEKGTINWITPTDLSRLENELHIAISERRVTERAMKETNLNLLPKGSIILSTRAPVGYVAVLDKESSFNQGCKGLAPKDQSRVCPEFYGYYLAYKKQALRNLSGGSTFLELSKNRLEKFEIPYMDYSEQRNVVLVLSRADEAINKTNLVITKIEHLKSGLVQQLLTHGIAHTEYRDTPIGRIPKEWDVRELGDERIADIVAGQSPPSSTYNKEEVGLPFLQGKMEFGEMYPSPTTYCSKPIKVAKKDDILLSVRAPVGDVNMAPFECCIGRGLAAIRARPDKLDHLFLFYYLKHQGRKFKALSSGSTFKAIRIRDIESFSVPVPSVKEQVTIAEILSEVYRKLELKRKESAKLEMAKRGLMDLLLTGKIRVRGD